jgi:membrane associated rhomboid family serine protease
MGIENRDYYRDENTPGYTWEDRRGGNSWSAVTWIIVITIGCFVVQLIAGRPFTERLLLDPAAVRHGAVWQLLTYAFLHDPRNIWHIVFNMWILHMSGRDFEARRGSAEFIAFYLFAAIVSGLGVFVWESTVGDGSPTLGASGAVSALLMVFAFTYPHAEIRIFGVLPMKMLTFAILIILFDSLPLLAQLSGRTEMGRDHISHSAHLAGIVLGILYQRNNWRVLNWLPFGGKLDWKRLTRRRPSLKVHRPEEPEPVPEEGFEQRVDELLDKVAREGEASLTADERRVLVEASRRARSKLSK